MKPVSPLAKVIAFVFMLFQLPEMFPSIFHKENEAKKFIKFWENELIIKA